MEAYRTEYVDARIMPGILYEYMVKQITPFSARGVLWYQGESDDVPGLQSLYTDMMKGLVSDWRKLWKDEALPFFEVQLPGWRDWMMQTNLDYATIRRCQEEAAKTVDGLYRHLLLMSAKNMIFIRKISARWDIAWRFWQENIYMERISSARHRDRKG